MASRAGTDIFPNVEAAAGDAPRPRLLILCPGVPHATRGASAILYYHYLAAIKELDASVLTVCLLPGHGDGYEDPDRLIREMSDERFRVVAMRQPGPMVRENSFSQAANPAFLEAVERVAAEFLPDILLCLDFPCAWLGASLQVKRKVVWLGDLYFKAVWYNQLYSMLESVSFGPRAVVNLLAVGVASRFWRRNYGRVLKEYDEVIVSSKSSEATLRKIGIDSTYEPYPWPAAERREERSAKNERPTFLMFGTLKALGGRSALRFLFVKLYPALVREFGPGGFTFLVAGRGSIQDWAKRELEHKPEIVFLGFVEDLDALIRESHAVVVPIDAPVGNRSRILTAMAQGALVVAHCNVALGNPSLVDGKTCFLVKKAKDFAKRLRQATVGGELIRTIAEQAYQSYRQEFHPDSACSKFVNRLSTSR